MQLHDHAAALSQRKWTHQGRLLTHGLNMGVYIAIREGLEGWWLGLGGSGEFDSVFVLGQNTVQVAEMKQKVLFIP